MVKTIGRTWVADASIFLLVKIHIDQRTLLYIYAIPERSFPAIELCKMLRLPSSQFEHNY